jgi:hypothetical protein
MQPLRLELPDIEPCTTDSYKGDVVWKRTYKSTRLRVLISPWCP